MSKPEGKGKFGDIAPTTRRKVSGRSAIKIFVIGFAFSIVGLLGAAAVKQGIEKSPPVITLAEQIAGVGIEARPFSFVVKDSGTGIRSCVVSLRRGDVLKVLDTVEGGRQHEINRSVDLVRSLEGVNDGPAEIVIEAVDDTVWGNRVLMVLPVILDRTEPKLDAVYVSPSLKAGGTGLVVYRATDANLVAHGVSAGRHFFKGELASHLFSDLSAPGVFATFISGEVGDSPELVASDVAGNRKGLRLKTQIEAVAESKRIIVEAGSPEYQEGLRHLLKAEGDLDRKIGKFLLKQVADASPEVGADLSASIIAAVIDARLNKIPRELSQLVVRNASQLRQWEGVPRSEVLRVKYNYRDFLTVKGPPGFPVEGQLDGVVFESIESAGAVIAPLKGQIKFVGDFGVLGQTVIVDNGFGLVSIFHNLGKIDVEVGATIESGRRIGSMGASGWATGTQLGIIVMVHGVAVDPKEWLEAKTFQQTVQLSLDQSRAKLTGR